MSNRSEFVQRQHDEVRATLEKLREHLSLCDEKLQEDPDDQQAAEWKRVIEDGIAALEPVLADFDNAGVDPEELIQYSQTIENWQGTEAELAKKLL